MERLPFFLIFLEPTPTCSSLPFALNRYMCTWRVWGLAMVDEVTELAKFNLPVNIIIKIKIWPHFP